MTTTHTVNNKEYGLYQEGEVYIKLTPRDLEHADPKGNVFVYLTCIELQDLLKLAQIREPRY